MKVRPSPPRSDPGRDRAESTGIVDAGPGDR